MTSTGRAVVVGASMGGLLAARVLAQRYDEVLLLDRDPLPAGPHQRRGVPQGRQLHILLARGRQALEELLPGLGADLQARGVPTVDLHGQVHWYNDGHRMRREPSALLALGVSRPALECAVRERVAGLLGVTIRTGCAVTGLTTTPDRSRVTGVRLVGAGSEETVEADLVVDAAGRGTRSPVWLAGLGYDTPAEERVRVDVTYVTRMFRRHPEHLEGLLGAFVNPVPGNLRGGVVAVQEDDRFAVVLSGLLGVEPPTDPAGMLDYARNLAAPQIAELLRGAEPLGPAVRMRFPESVRRRYERLRRFPAGYLVVADALCSFNPTYGQGMTVAALEALLLRRLLADPGPRLARRFFAGAARLIDRPWAISVGTDLRFPAVAGRRTPRVRLVNAYLARVYAAAATDPALGLAFLRVINLIDPPARLLAPGRVLRVLRAGAGQRPSASSMAR